MSTTPEDNLSTQSVKRLPLYLRILSDMRDSGETFASSAVVAQLLNLDPIMVRKDLAGCGITGTPRRGFPLAELLVAVESILGCNTSCEAVMVGVGKLGAALLGYPGFALYGIQIVAAFDLKPVKLEGSSVPVYPMNMLQDVILQTGAKIGIVTVPAEAAQDVTDKMIAGGVKGIWNFTPAHLRVPNGVITKHENLATSLVVLSHRMRAAKLI